MQAKMRDVCLDRWGFDDLMGRVRLRPHLLSRTIGAGRWQHALDSRGGQETLSMARVSECL